MFPVRSHISQFPQVLNANGEKSGDIPLLKKSHFIHGARILPLISLLNPMRIFSRNTRLGQMKHELNVQKLKQHANNLRHQIAKEEAVDYDHILTPIRSTFTELSDLQSIPKNTIQKFEEMFGHLLRGSIDFFERTDQNKTDSQLSPRDQYRALTNYWANLILIYVLENNDENNCSHTPGEDAYSYSYLYPYTDNIMDLQKAPEGAKSIKEVKSQFVHNLQTKLKNVESEVPLAMQGNMSAEQQEERVYELISKTVRKENKGLLQSLNAIHQAQKQSLKQECEGDIGEAFTTLSKQDKTEIFDITIIKGAATVLPNAYMLNPNLTQEQAELSATIGYLGQILNDIEGIEEDLTEKRFTPATMNYIKHGNIDRLLKRTFVHIERLKRSVASKFPNLNQQKVVMLLDVFRARLVTTAAYANGRSQKSILSNTAIERLEQFLGVNIDLIAQIAKIEHQLFGGLCDNTHSSDDPREKISDPVRLKQFVLQQVDEFISRMEA